VQRIKPLVRVGRNQRATIGEVLAVNRISYDG
jgi:hypothetical protein